MDRLLRITFLLLIASASCASDVVLVVPEPLTSAVDTWKAFRESQGHRVVTVTPSFGTAETVRRMQAAFGRLGEPSAPRTVILVGDGGPGGAPTGLVASKVVHRWGPERNIATDIAYADTDGDGAIDASVGRLPFHERGALEDYLDRVIQREQSPPALTDRDLRLVAGFGGFSPLIDMTIEASAKVLVNRYAPLTSHVSLTKLQDADAGAAAWRSLQAPRGVWVYMGHGLRDRLQGMPSNPAASFSRSGADAAVLLACYAGAYEREQDCFAESLIKDPSGPLVVVASTRVSAPYGNAAIGLGLLRQLNEEGAEDYGSALLAAKQMSQGASSDDSIRLLGSVAATAIGQGYAPEEEIVDHQAMYHLLGDPLLQISRPQPLEIEAAVLQESNGALLVSGVAPHDGQLRVELAKGHGTSPVRAAERLTRSGEPFHIKVSTSSVGTGTWRVTATLLGPRDLSVGSTQVLLGKATAASRIASEPSREGRLR